MGLEGQVEARPVTQVAARLVHVTDGRARLRLLRPTGREAMLDLADRLAAIPGIRRVVVRPNTGSVIIEAVHDEAALRAALESASAMRLVAPAPPIQVGPAAKLGLLGLDKSIKDSTHQSLDLRSTLAVLLLAGAVVQLARGRIAAPATTLLLAALSMLGGPPGK